MGTRGYKVYRWRGWYFVYYNHWDSYPSGLGVEFLATIPKFEKDFEKWLAKMRRKFDEKIAAHEQGDSDHDNEEEGATIRKEAPCNDIMIEWIYEIDLDRLVFHVDSQPLFRLDHLPGNDLFLESIGFDHYGHRAYTSSTPPEYRYNWDAPPPVVADAAVELYKNQAAGSAVISDLLSVSESMNDREAVRVQVLQVIIGNLMRTANMGLVVRELTQVPDYNHLSLQDCSLAWYLIDIAIDFQIFSNKLVSKRQHGSHQTQWQRKDICVHLTTHLDDQRNMQAAVACLVADVMKRPDNPTDIVYGVAFSIFHCVIVRIDTRKGFTFEHSDALQFLPSFYATSPSTPGITALARLGYHPDDELISKVAAHVHPYDLVHTRGLPDPLRHIKPIFPKDVFEGLIKGVLKPPGGGLIGRLLPQELWELVAFQLYDPKDLLMFAWLSAECRTAAEDALRDPIIGEYRLVQALESSAKIDSEVEDEYTEFGYEYLNSARFKVVSSTGHGIMNLGEPGAGAYGIKSMSICLPIDDLLSIRFSIED